jgi:hypothetical protein
MVHVVGRRPLRATEAPRILLALSTPPPSSSWPAPSPSRPSTSAGVMGSRWLFLAQAEHVVGLYYGAR